MDSIASFFTIAFKYITSLSVSDIIDILIVAAIFYWLIGFIRRTNATKVADGIVVLLVVMWLSGVLKLSLTNYLLKNVFEIGVIAVIVLFQPEIRRALEKVGSQGFSFLGREVQSHTLESAIMQTVFACEAMSRTRTGALIVFERDNRLTDIISTGTLIDAQISAELIKNIFFDKAPLHDGALIIRDGRVAAAGCMLPLSSNASLSRDLGMRHRAGIGMSEHSDAVVVIVSEETGSVSLAVDGMLKRHLSQDTFETLLRKELIPKEPETRSEKRIRQKFEKFGKTIPRRGKKTVSEIDKETFGQSDGPIEKVNEDASKQSDDSVQ
jgi:diadenylate cyclase